MNDERLDPGTPIDAQTDDDADRNDAVIAADDTGMLAGERLITIVEVEEGLDGKTLDGNVS